jgi:hypothetical protein
MNTFRRALLAALLLFQLPWFCSRSGLRQPRPGAGDGSRNCCNASRRFGPIQIAGRADQVPIELQFGGCPVHGEEVTAIEIDGEIMGCAEESSSITFRNLHIKFTTDKARCGMQGVRTPDVFLTDVVYDTGHIRITETPPCVAGSSVTNYKIDSIVDSGFHTLFVTNGGATLRPILDHLMLRWASSPPGTCPPSPNLGTPPGNILVCPRG